MSPTDINGASTTTTASVNAGTGALTPGATNMVPGSAGTTGTSAIFPGLLDPTAAKRQRLAASACYAASAQAAVAAQAAAFQQAAALAQHQQQQQFFNTGMLSGVPVTSSALQQVLWAGKAAAQMAQTYKSEADTVNTMVRTAREWGQLHFLSLSLKG